MERIKYNYLHKIMFPKGATVMQYEDKGNNIKRSRTFGNPEDIYTEVYSDTPDYADGKAKALVNITFKLSQTFGCEAKDITISKHSLVVVSIIRHEGEKPVKPRKKSKYKQLDIFDTGGEG